MGGLIEVLEGYLAMYWGHRSVAWFRRSMFLYLGCHITADMVTDLYSASIFLAKGETMWGGLMFATVFLTNLVNAGISFFTERHWSGVVLGVLGLLPTKHTYSVLGNQDARNVKLDDPNCLVVDRVIAVVQIIVYVAVVVAVAAVSCPCRCRGCCCRCRCCLCW